MLYLGEDIPARGIGARLTSLKLGHSSLFSGHRVEGDNDFAESNWTPSTMKLFEPILLDLVSEDGSGPTRLFCAKSSLSLHDRVAFLLSQKITDQASVSVGAPPSVSSPIPVVRLFPDFRAAAYFTTVLKMNRGFAGLEPFTGAAKSIDKSHLALVNTIIQLIPNVGGSQGGHSVSSKSVSQVDLMPPKVYPDKVAWQRFQAFLDIRLSARISTMLNADDLSTRIACFELCSKALIYCSSLIPEALKAGPFWTFSMELTSTNWVTGIVEGMTAHTGKVSDT